MVVSGELNNGREAGGRMAGKGFMKKCQRKVNKWNRPWYGPHRAHNQLKWWLRNSRGLYSAPRSFTVTLNPLLSHQCSMMNPDRSYGSPIGWEEAASRSRPPKTSSFWQWNLIVYWCVFVFVTKNWLPVKGDKTSFAEPVTYTLKQISTNTITIWNVMMHDNRYENWCTLREYFGNKYYAYPMQYQIQSCIVLTSKNVSC